VIVAGVQLDNGNSVIAVDQFALSSNGTVKDTETDGKILGWTLGADVSASSQSIKLTVDGDSGAMLEADIAISELVTSVSSVGDVLVGGERVVKWDFLAEESGTATTLDLDVYDSEGLLVAVDARTSEDASAGTRVSTANVSLKQDSQLETLGGVRFETVDSGARAAAELQLLGADLQQPFLHLNANINFTAASAARLLTDWDAAVVAQLRDPGDSTTLLMSMLVTGASQLGVFTSEMSMKDSEGTEVVSWSMEGTSSSDSITTQGTIGSDMVVKLALSKPDGRLDTMTQMDSTVTVEGGEMAISFGVGYDGTDTWDMSGSVSENGDTTASIEAHLHEEWVSVVSWASEGVGDLIGVGRSYVYVNASIPSISDFSDMWELNYVRTSDFIETTNVTWHTDASVAESILSVSSYTMERDDSGEWRYISSVNFTVDHTEPPAAPTPAPPAPSTMIVEGTFMVSVAAAKAQAFIGNFDVEDSFVASIAQRAGVLESTVKVTLSVVSGNGRRLTQTSDQVEILVTYVITAQVGASNDAAVTGDSVLDNMVDTLTSTSAEEFVADFASEFQTTDSASNFSAVMAVPGSATAPTTTEATDSMSGPTTTEATEASGAHAAFSQALLLTTICMLMV
jgi:hypothetical protein